MNTIRDLPKVSDQFLMHIKGSSPRMGDWMPCPSCGSREVEVPGRRSLLLGGLFGVGCVGASGCFAAAVAAVSWFLALGIAGWAVAAIILTIGLGFGGLLVLSGALPLKSYRCNSCTRSWTFQDVEDLLKMLG